jgi:hypothetical protein
VPFIYTASPDIGDALAAIVEILQVSTKSFLAAPT